MNTELLKSKLLEAAFNGSLTHADTSTWKDLTLGEVISFLRTGLNPRVHFSLNTDDADGYYITIRELKGLTFEPDSKTDRINKAAVLRINERSRLKVGDVLLSGTATIGRTAIVHEEPTNWGIKEGVYALTPKHDIITSKYLVYYLHSPKAVDTMLLYATGSTVKSVAMAKLSTLPIVVPPLAEQQRIVAALEEGFAYIDAVASAKQNLSDTAELLRSKILQVAMQGKLVPQDKNEEAASVLIAKIKGEIQSISDEEVPFEIPSNWVWVRHNELFDISGGTQPPKSEFIDEPRAGYIQLYQIRDYGPKPQPVYVPYKKTLKISKKGDILLARYGASLGKVFIAKEGAYNVAIARVVPLFKEDYIDKKFLYLYYKSSIYQTHITKHSRSAQAGFNKEDLKEMLFPLPPLAEQQRIVGKIEELFTQIDKITK